jgi:hypothetical protein
MVMMPKRGVPSYTQMIRAASTAIPTSTVVRNERKSLKMQGLHTQSSISGL